MDSSKYHHRGSSATTSSTTSASSASSQTSALAATRPRDTFTQTRRGTFPAFRLKRHPFRRREGPSRNSRFYTQSPVYRTASACYEPLINGSRIRLGQGTERHRWRSFRRWGWVSSCVMLFAVVFCPCLRCVRGSASPLRRRVLLISWGRYSIHFTGRAGLARPIDSVSVSAVQIRQRVEPVKGRQME